MNIEEKLTNLIKMSNDFSSMKKNPNQDMIELDNHYCKMVDRANDLLSDRLLNDWLDHTTSDTDFMEMFILSQEERTYSGEKYLEILHNQNIL